MIDNLIITGASGFIARSLLDQRFPKYGNLILTDKARRHETPSLLICEGSSSLSVEDRIFSRLLADSQNCTILHFGGDSSTSADFSSCYYNNYIFTKNILESVKVRPNIQFNLFFASSASVYGHNKQQSVDAPIAPMSFYAKSKAECEDLIINSGLSNLKYKIGRIFNVIPTSDNFHFESHKISRSPLYEYFVNSGRVTLFNRNLRVSRDFISTDLLYHRLFKIMSDEFNNTIENIGSGVSLSFEEVFYNHHYSDVRISWKEKEFDWSSYQFFTQAI